jgi:hypothetical protein
MDLYPHKSGLGLMESVALIGHNVVVRYANQFFYRRVVYLEPIPPFQALNIGAIAAQNTSPRTQAVALQLYKNEFGQFRWYPLDNAQVRLFQPSADGRFILRQLQVAVDPTIITRDPCLHMTEFFEWEDRNPAFEAINFSDYALVQCRIIVEGYRFVTEELSADTVAKIKSGLVSAVNIVTSGYAGVP